MHPSPDTNPRPIHVALQHLRTTLCGRIGAMLADSDAGFIDQFPQLVDAVEAGFRHEEAILEQRSDARLHARRESNATVLCALHRIAPQVELGNAALGRQAATALHAVLSAPGFASDLAPVRGALPAPVRWRTSRPGGLRHARWRH